MLKMSILILLLVIFTVDAEDQNCPGLFLRYSKKHTYCQPPSASCNILRSSVTNEDMKVILNEHNNYRNGIATGQVKQLPPASNMMQMVWDDDLAAVAQAHANQCKFEHDCSNCRRVQNFGVGQNLAIETSSPITPNKPSPNWPSAIKSWYDEIEYFHESKIEPFAAPPANPTYGHFTQLVWAGSWRVGCGYVLYTEDDQYKKLYVCNYGPAGNIVEGSMYEKNKTCSGCPANSCCGKSCGKSYDYPGLCQITDDREPVYKTKEQRIFDCDFQSQNPDCAHQVTGTNKWLVYNTLSGNYLGIVLDGGEKSTMVFNSLIKPEKSLCVVINYRKGPNVDGQEEASVATETFSLPLNNYEVNQPLPNFGSGVEQQFSAFSMSLGWDMETQYKVTFSVPPGMPQQFLEIRSLYALEGPCPP